MTLADSTHPLLLSERPLTTGAHLARTDWSRSAGRLQRWGSIGGSVQSHRVARRTRPAHDLERRPHEHELIDAILEQLGELEVLEIPDAVLGLEVHMAGVGLARVLAGDGLGGEGIATRQGDLPLGEIFARADAEARLALAELLPPLRLFLGGEGRPLGAAPEITVAGVDEHAVTLPISSSP